MSKGLLYVRLSGPIHDMNENTAPQTKWSNTRHVPPTEPQAKWPNIRLSPPKFKM
jgi:hypothetical protein